MMVIRWIVMLTVSGYVAIVSVLYLAQRRFVFVLPRSIDPTPADAGWPEAEETVIDNPRAKESHPL
jgi:hypothetical protein